MKKSNQCLILTDDWVALLKADYTEDSKCQKILQKINSNKEYYTKYKLNEDILIYKESLLYISNIMMLKKKTL